MTRQWNTDPRLMCQKHLLGEHFEIHKSLGLIRHGRSVYGWVRKGQVDPITYYARHAQLVFEMMRRGGNHKTDLDTLGLVLPQGNIDLEYNKIDLSTRCEKCREGIENGTLVV